jgi:hypothetical protein
MQRGKLPFLKEHILKTILITKRTRKEKRTHTNKKQKCDNNNNNNNNNFKESNVYIYSNAECNKIVNLFSNQLMIILMMTAVTTMTMMILR